MASANTIRAIAGATIKIAHLTPWDLTGQTITSQLRDDHGNGDFMVPLDAELQVNPKTGVPGLILVVISAELSQSLISARAGYCYDIRIESASGEVIYTPKINLILSQRVTRVV